MKDIESQVCEDIKARQQIGIPKYGFTVAENPAKLKEWLNHAYQECLDQAVYLKRAMAEMDVNSGNIQQVPEKETKPVFCGGCGSRIWHELWLKCPACLTPVGTNPIQKKCNCRKCVSERQSASLVVGYEFVGMIACETCGNKRCPKGTDHRNDCTGSNEPGQAGSVFL